jgi:hypothetical protein
MDVINARNVEEALLLGGYMINARGVLQDSRNGPVKVMPMPVTTFYSHPRERVMFLPERDCNPFFHFMESLWMLEGRRDVEWISRFSANIGNYSDDGVNFHGAYGFRWRNHFREGEFVVDQLATIANILRENPNDRRAVLQMWDSVTDLGMEGKDFPCNLIITFRINVKGHLDMTVFNRSNDMIWGAYGANAVHMSFLQEVMAAWIEVPVGQYWQISTNFHAYTDTLEKIKPLLNQSPGFTEYDIGDIRPFDIVNSPIGSWFKELNMFMEEGTEAMGYNDPFFRKVAIPMMRAWEKWKDKDMQAALVHANDIAASDWRKACVEWLERRA